MTRVEYASSHTLLHRRVRAGSLWFAVLAGPIAAFANQQLEYVLTAWSCGRLDPLSHVLLQLVPAALILLCGVAGLVAWRARTAPIDADDEHLLDADRSRRGFMAILGIGLSAFGAIAILAQWIAVWFINPCMLL